MNEKKLTITVSFEPELTKAIEKTTVEHYDLITGNKIPKGSPCYSLGIRWNGRRKLIAGYVSATVYHTIIKKL